MEWPDSELKGQIIRKRRIHLINYLPYITNVVTLHVLVPCDLTICQKAEKKTLYVILSGSSADNDSGQSLPMSDKNNWSSC